MKRRSPSPATTWFDRVAEVDAMNARLEALLSTLLNVRQLSRAELAELAELEGRLEVIDAGGERRAQLLSLEVA